MPEILILGIAVKFLQRSGMYLVLVFALTGCNTVSEGQFNNAKAVLSGSPTLRIQKIQDCVAIQKNASRADKKFRAGLTGASIAKYPGVFCSRLINALASGRITYEDYKRLDRPDADSSKVIRIAQGH